MSLYHEEIRMEADLQLAENAIALLSLKSLAEYQMHFSNR